jgi:hypothetical protein
MSNANETDEREETGRNSIKKMRDKKMGQKNVRAERCDADLKVTRYGR